MYRLREYARYAEDNLLALTSVDPSVRGYRTWAGIGGRHSDPWYLRWPLILVVGLTSLSAVALFVWRGISKALHFATAGDYVIVTLSVGIGLAAIAAVVGFLTAPEKARRVRRELRAETSLPRYAVDT